MEKTFKYRLYPNKLQRDLIERSFGCCRWVYNRCLDEREAHYKETGRYLSVFDLQKMITVWKKTDYPWLSDASASALQSAVEDLGKSYDSFYARMKQGKKANPPKHKRKKSDKQSFRVKNTGSHVAILDDKHIKIPKLGSVKCKVSRNIEGRIISVTVRRSPSGKYYAIVLCTDCLVVHMPKGRIGVMGIDVGVRNLITRSDGVKVPNPQALISYEDKIRREQKKLSRKKKGSANYEKQRRRLSRVYEKARNVRQDAIHKATLNAVRNSQAIAVEDLDVIGMMEGRSLSKRIADASMGEIIRQLEYKSLWYGRDFVKVDRFFPSSRICRGCGEVYDGLTLAMETWVCPNCLSDIDRDLNAAFNIADEGSFLLYGTARSAGNSSNAVKCFRIKRRTQSH